MRRSDGRRNAALPNSKKTEPNRPTNEQMSKTAKKNGTFTYYLEVPLKDSKNVEWRKKLGGLLVQELRRTAKASPREAEDKSDSDEPLGQSEHILVDFPENYVLYEHRRELNPNQPEAKGKAHSEYFLYGHPQGRRKRYKNSAEFFPHLLWLATDETADPENCSCIICTPNELQQVAEELEAMQRAIFQPEAKPAARPDALVTNRPASTGPKSPTDAPKKPTTAMKVPQSSKPPGQSVTVAPTPPTGSTAAPTTAPAQSMEPTRPVPPRSTEQNIDARPNTFIFRSGEVVWYVRRAQSEVGLAMVTARELVDVGKDRPQPTYVVQPLWYPLNHPRAVLVQDQTKLKPYLAFSTPEIFVKALDRPGINYERIDWKALLDGKYGQVSRLDIENDAQTFAAKSVDSTYTPVEPILSADNGSNTVGKGKGQEIQYNGLYLGNEKIWVGEAVRLRDSSSASSGAKTDILIVSAITEQLTVAHAPADVLVTGDVYSYRTGAHNPARRRMPPNTYLPARVQQDLEYRNAASIARAGHVSHWQLVRPRARISVAELAGRWYESRTVLPIIYGDAHARRCEQDGNVPDVAEGINARGESASVPVKVGERKGNRLQAFGLAVPRGTQVGGKIPQAMQPQLSRTPSSATPTPTPPPQIQQGQSLRAPQPPPTLAPEASQTSEPAPGDAVMSDFMGAQLEDGDYSQGYLGHLGTGGQF